MQRAQKARAEPSKTKGKGKKKVTYAGLFDKGLKKELAKGKKSMLASSLLEEGESQMSISGPDNAMK